MDIKKIAVIGGGTMGNGIAHVFAMKGFDVFL
ncbi:MAG TPA: 3-hydroxyacyl-CoA dehydrogenase NAD-binding domain-containing protein, partial [Ignavibacteriaceae bacterium]